MAQDPCKDALPLLPEAAAPAAACPTGAGEPTPLFDAPPARLGQRLHTAVFGALPHSTARALDVPEVAAAVRPLLAAGWRPAQLAARVGALPAADEPVRPVLAFLAELAARDSPQQAWSRERAERERERAQREADAPPVASAETRARRTSEIRRGLGLLPAPRVRATTRTAPPCAGCGSAGAFFVTRQVRLCERCVELLASGQGQVALAARAG